ncbi:MAG TPA: redoxin family protein [Patescibacteria group bacterium]|nr:redoxin family protein [Patescibacteria group bacterium]
MFRKNKVDLAAPEFPLNLEWINSEPLTMRRLRGRVVLIDIWAYSCVNCQRTLPHIKDWHKKYEKKGLTIIGVHAPEFEFEKDKKNVEQAVSDAEITYPVVLDDDQKIWNLYQNQWWPRKLLINKGGTIIYDHIGEGSYEETESAIQSALLANGGRSMPAIHGEGVKGGVCRPVTPETYLGFARGVLANRNEVEKNHFHEYQKSKAKSLPSLEGKWKVTREYVESGGGTLCMPYSAGEVNLVMELAEDAARSTIAVTSDGESISRGDVGNDIKFDGDETKVEVKASRMYNLLMSSDHQDAELRLEVPKGVRLYAFTFGGTY